MPRFPAPSPASACLQPAVFTRLLPLFERLPEPPLPLHIGDTYLDPPPDAQLQVVSRNNDRAFYPYSSPNGDPALRRAFCRRWSGLGLENLTPERVHVTVGATGAVQAAFRTFAGAGDEVLVLAPYWPLVRGIALSCAAVPVEVPFYDRLRTGATVEELLAPHTSARTSAVYMCSPNNPDGHVLSETQQRALADYCIAHDLWLISDEAYCDHVFSPATHRFIANLPGMAERTASIYTTSKSYALAGIRIGFLVGDPRWLEAARRVSTHQVYNVPLVNQRAAIAAIETGDVWLRSARARYAEAASYVHEHLEATFAVAEGGGYVFCDVTEALGEKPTLTWIGELLYEGVAIAPGVAFGREYERWVRICYMSLPLPALAQAVTRLNRSLDRLRRGAPVAYEGPRLTLSLGDHA